jgi:hypothetical protein
MKKLLYIPTTLFAVAAMFASCAGEEDNIFDSSAAIRMEQAAEHYTQLLQSSPGGWVLQYYPTNGTEVTTGQGYLWLLKFNNDLSVDVATKNMFTNNIYSEATSAWEVISDNGPVLTFNSYNPNIHIFSDPDLTAIPGSSENVWGVGVGGDYEFVIVDAAEDQSYVMLKGKKRGTYNLLTRLPEGTDFLQYFDEVDSIQDILFPGDTPNNRMMSFNGNRYIVSDVVDGYVSFFPEDGDEISETEDYPYLIYKDGNDFYLRFRENVIPQEMEENSGIQLLRWDAANDRFVDPDNANKWMEFQFTAEEFFTQEFNKAHTFKVLRSSPEAELSEKMRAVLEAAHAGIKGVNKNNFIDEVKLRIDTENGVRWMFKYQSGKSAKDVEYIYSCNLQGNTITFNYQKADQTNGENIKNRVGAISSMLEQTLSQSFTISKYITNFNQRKMLFTALNDPDLWFVINY